MVTNTSSLMPDNGDICRCSWNVLWQISDWCKTLVYAHWLICRIWTSYLSYRIKHLLSVILFQKKLICIAQGIKWYRHTCWRWRGISSRNWQINLLPLRILHPRDDINTETKIIIDDDANRICSKDFYWQLTSSQRMLTIGFQMLDRHHSDFSQRL